MKYDKPLIAVLIGFISALAYEIFTRILMAFGYGKYSLYQLDSFVVTLNKPIEAFGIIVSFGVSSFIAGVLFYSEKKLGTDYFIVKSIIISLMFWIVLEAIFTSSIEGRFIPARPVSDYYVHFLGTIAYGFTQGLLFKKFIIKPSGHQST